MYNKIVATLLLLAVVSALGGAAHAQYYSRSYAAAYGNAFGSSGDSYFNTRYSGQWQGPVFRPTNYAPSTLNFGYVQNNIQVPNFQPMQISPITTNFQYAAAPFGPTYNTGGSGLGGFSFNAPHFTPNYGSGSLGLGGIGLNLGARQIPSFGGGMGFDSYQYSFRPAIPIYMTPSRILFDADFGYSFGAY